MRSPDTLPIELMVAEKLDVASPVTEEPNHRADPALGGSLLRAWLRANAHDQRAAADAPATPEPAPSEPGDAAAPPPSGKRGAVARLRSRVR